MSSKSIRLRREINSTKLRLQGEVWRYYPYSYKPKMYLVSSYGRVISVKSSKYRRKYRLLRGNVNRGYRFYTLKVNTEGKQKTFHAHRLVLETFDRKRRKNEVGRHLDDVPLNNHLDNIKWGTQRQNVDDALRNDRIHYGEDVATSKISNNDARSIFIDPRPYDVLAKLYNVTYGTIHGIKCSKVFSKITKELTVIKYDNLHNIRGENNHNSRVTNDVAVAVYQDTGTHKEIADKYGISVDIVGAIRRGDRYKNCTKNLSKPLIKGCKKISNTTVIKIIGSKLNNSEIARRLGVDNSTISRIRSNAKKYA